MKAVKPLKTRAFIAKLLVLCMVLTLLPVSAFAVDAGDWENQTGSNKMYYKITEDTTFTGSIGNAAEDVYYIYADAAGANKLVTLSSTSTINSTLYVGTDNGPDGAVSGQTQLRLAVDGATLNGALSIWPNVTIEKLTFASDAVVASIALDPVPKTVLLKKGTDGSVATVAGNIEIPTGVTLEVEGKLEIPTGKTLTVNGNLTVDDGAEITIASGATLELESTAQVTLSGDIIIDSGATYTNSNANITFNNGSEIITAHEVVADGITAGGKVNFTYKVSGDTHTITLVEDEAYNIASDTDVTVDLIPESSNYRVSANSTYTVGNDTKHFAAGEYGAPVSATFALTDDVTINAVFEAKPADIPPYVPGPSTPSATVKTEAATNGSFTVSDQNAKAGDTVTVKPTPAAGYMVDAVTVTDKNGDSVAVKNNGDGTYSFVMPEASKQPVTVKVTFKPVPVFSDVKADDYFADAVDWAVSLGYVSGKGDGKFVPYAGCTRAEFITILYAMTGRPEPTLTTTDFEDVDYDAFYGKALLWATEKGVCSGVTATKFAPNAVISRAQAVMMLYKAADTPEVPAGATMKFTDVAENAYYYNAVLWASSVGAIAGVTDTTFAPNADCLRAQTVTILHSYKTAD